MKKVQSLSKTKAIFLDRDGVINIEKEYLYKIEDFEFINGVFDSLLYLQQKGFLLFIITNQSGINRGYYTKDDFDILTSWMIKEFLLRNITISSLEFCPHRPNENCLCRKPNTLMIDNILKSYNIDLNNSWLIGDKASDILCALKANIKNSIQVRSGHKFDENLSKATFIIDSIKDIKAII
jgi:D-glycero-D-manno-heptose 1,7-bisphosphate phosphatase